ncbi:MAG: MBL fold metallo-hydrolase [Pseudomonadota bacterium]
MLTENGRPLLQVDAGFGVVRTFRKNFSEPSCPILITHNHSDHAAELPVLGALLYKAGIREALLAEQSVLTRLVEHRLHELRSTGLSLDSFFDFHAINGPEKHSLTRDFEIELIHAKHSERSFGFILYHEEKAIFSASSDSGYSNSLYRKLSQAPIVMLDGREQGNHDHASFSDIETWAGENTDIDVWVTGYGICDYKPSNFRLVAPGEPICLKSNRKR